MADAIANETLVREFYTQYRARNREAVEAMMHPEFAFSSPYDDHISRTDYFQRCWGPGDRMKNLTIENTAVTNQYVFIEYKGIWEGGHHWRNVEVFHVEDGKVKHIRVYFGDPVHDEANARQAEAPEAPHTPHRPSLLEAIGF